MPPPAADLAWGSFLDGRAVVISVDDAVGASRRARLLGRTGKGEEGDSLGAMAAVIRPRLKMRVAERDPEGGLAGCFRSHVAAHRDALESAPSGVAVPEWTLFLEDDAVASAAAASEETVRRVGEQIARLAGRLRPGEPCVIQLGYVALLGKHRVLEDDARSAGLEHLWPVNGSVCMHSYLANRAASERFAALEFDGKTPIDAHMGATPHYVVHPILMHQADEGTSIGGLSHGLIALQGSVGPDAVGEVAFFCMRWSGAIVGLLVFLIAAVAAGFGVAVAAAADGLSGPLARNVARLPARGPVPPAETYRGAMIALSVILGAVLVTLVMASAVLADVAERQYASALALW